MSQPPRFAARSAVLYDLSLSEGARLLYLALDDEAQGHQSIFAKQQRQAARMGVTDREIRRRMGELERAGYIVIRQTGRSNVTEFVWKIPDHTVHSDRTAQSGLTGPPGPLFGARISIDKNQERQQEKPPTPLRAKTENPGVCQLCFGLGYTLVEKVFRGSGYVERQDCQNCRRARAS